MFMICNPLSVMRGDSWMSNNNNNNNNIMTKQFKYCNHFNNAMLCINLNNFSISLYVHIINNQIYNSIFCMYDLQERNFKNALEI